MCLWRRRLERRCIFTSWDRLWSVRVKIPGIPVPVRPSLSSLWTAVVLVPSPLRERIGVRVKSRQEKPITFCTDSTINGEVTLNGIRTVYDAAASAAAVTPSDSYDRDIELIVQADKLGVREAWIGEHITETWENAPVPELIIAQALALTENIILGTGVTMLPLHHPVDTAHRIAMLDHMARGRLYWGIGLRSLPTDLQLYGVEYDTHGRCA